MMTFRRPHMIQHTIASIQAQTYRQWELIIVDNAGDANYHFADPRIRLVCHAEQASASYARNTGLRYATGGLVCFFDDDDEMFPHYLEQFVATFRAHPAAKLVRCGMILVNGRTNFSYATPECCLRRQYAIPTWSGGRRQDQEYFKGIVQRQGWSVEHGDIVIITEALCRCTADPRGGLRSGGF